MKVTGFGLPCALHVKASLASDVLQQSVWQNFDKDTKFNNQDTKWEPYNLHT